MSLDPSKRPISPASSGRASPAPRFGRPNEDDGLKKDKGYRRYAAGIERALASFDAAQQEWADYIAFLGRLLKAIQSAHSTVDSLPYANTVALRLAQCLNSSLPSGVHQKALEVYSCIFGIIGKDALAGDLHIFLPGLSPVLSFASLAVRPLYYDLFDQHVLLLNQQSLRPAAKSLILCLLPGIEDETSEDFDEGIRILDKLRKSLGRTDDGEAIEINDGYFWQCFFLAVITNASRRQGALAYMTRKLPRLVPSKSDQHEPVNGHATQDVQGLPAAAEAVLYPEPGLLIRCFAAGLQDPQMLVQRGFLDLLVTHIPLHSPVLQDRIERNDLNQLVSAAIGVVLRRDMSLNRRLWSWFLGPDSSSEVVDDAQPLSPSSERDGYTNGSSIVQAKYFQQHGASSLRECLLAMLDRPTGTSSDRARPFRICLSLMDRWEVGGSLVPNILMPALDNAFHYSQAHQKKQVDEVLRSASLFFDGVESSLIWSKFILLMLATFDQIQSDLSSAERNLDFLTFITHNFNIREEDMLVRHIPNATFALLSCLASSLSDPPLSFTNKALRLLRSLVTLIPTRAFGPSHPSTTISDAGERSSNAWYSEQCHQTAQRIKEVYGEEDTQSALENPLVKPRLLGECNVHMTINILIRALNSTSLQGDLSQLYETLLSITTKVPSSEALRHSDLFKAFRQALMSSSATVGASSSHKFAIVNSLMSMMSTLSSSKGTNEINDDQLLELQPAMMEFLWKRLSPWEPKHHVETVRLIWQLETLTKGQRVEAQLALFIGTRLDTQSREQEECGRFATLWEHTMQSILAKGEVGRTALIRRPSGLPPSGDLSAGVDLEMVLSRPLFLLLDNLQEDDTETTTFLITWLQDLPSLDRVFSIILSKLQTLLKGYKSQSGKSTLESRRQRHELQSLQEIMICIQHLRNILKNASMHTWEILSNLHPESKDPEQPSPSGLQFLASKCLEVLSIESNASSSSLHHSSLAILQILLSSPESATLKDMTIEDALIAHLSWMLEHNVGSLQTVYLQTILSALKVRVAPSVQEPPSSASTTSLSLSRNQRPQLQSTALPPANILDCLKAGLSSPASRLFLDHWTNFLANILPLYADAIFSNMIPLVECFCDQITIAFRYLRSVSTTVATNEDPIPVPILPTLLHGLELLLAHAHARLQRQEFSSATVKPPEQGQGQSFFGNMVSGVFSADGLPSKTARVNSRLTVILCMQDAVRICYGIWAWASYGIEGDDVDSTCSATMSFNTLKLRNRTRRILEHLFLAEGLECLETLAVIWLGGDSGIGIGLEASSVFSLLHVLNGSKPRNTIPVILNALYSRTNLEALEVGRRSTLTCDLTGSDIVAFLIAYLRTVEDDAVDEIWTDCTTFLRDVLSNPMPHRQVLPALLEFIILLAEKIDNTNFGELRRMRRELGDIFIRLLAATFAARPQGGMLSSPALAQQAQNGIDGLQHVKPDFIASLLNVAPKLSFVLESNDRILNAVGNISNHVIGPAIHARSFPDSIGPGHLQLLLYISEQGPTAKSWKKDVSDAFNDARIISSSTDLMQNGWMPVFRKWSLSDKDRLPDLLSRLVAPSAAGIMFGVGANAARLDADRKTQLNLRRIALLLLSCKSDTFVSSLSLMDEKLSELATATLSSSPSSTTRAEFFMVFRALILSISFNHLSAIWPMINATMQAALASAIPGSHEQETYNNASLLQACKLLDLLITITPDEFQLHEWLYITDTIDAVYRPDDWTPDALVDEVAESLGAEESSLSSSQYTSTPVAQQTTSGGPTRSQFLNSSLNGGVDGADVKAMARDEFVRGVLRPFFSQLSMYAYEATYGMGGPDVEGCRQALVQDLLDEGTIL